MQPQLLPGEQLQKEGAANCMRGAESVGGRLFCTNQRLIFESHAFNIQTGNTVVELSQISATRPAWTKFLGVLPIVPNSFEIQLHDDTIQSFVEMGRTDWIVTIERLRTQTS